MPVVTKKRPKVFDFQNAPPPTVYLDSSFLLNVLVSGSSYHAECVTYAHQLEAAKKRSGLLPRDALHATTALEIGINAIVTTDADFVQVEALAIYTCNPILLRQR